MAECLANHAEGTYPCGHLRLRRRLSQRYEDGTRTVTRYEDGCEDGTRTVRGRYEADHLAQFQSIMVDQEPYMELWQEARKRETAASAVAG
jgi:hypothetical protein